MLALGDVVGEAAGLFLRQTLPRFRRERGVDLILANGENSAVKGGIDRASTELLFSAGVDLITTGNHVFRQREIYDLLDGAGSLLRPCNFPAACPGVGHTVLSLSGLRILVINVQGTLFMEPLASPFETVEGILKKEEGRYDLAFCDFHGETTSEKKAFAYHFDSRLNAVFGTHTHVPTADLQVLPGGTAYISDLGMCGPRDSVLGMEKDGAIRKFITHMPTWYKVASGPREAWGALFEFDPDSGKCLSLEQVHLVE
ncbi:MAG: YmdB family metallophosphoesterase [Clostridia bacterium]|nr:YmdB family metallophosphoesterase [Clostridia bacterium]